MKKKTTPKLSPEEKELRDSFERGEWKPVRKIEDAALRYRGYARSTFEKDRRINIRISSRDLDGIKTRAIEEGIPYQTLISSVLHKYVSGRVIERP